MKAKKSMEIYLYCLLKLGSKWGGLLKPHTDRFISWKVELYALYRRLGGQKVRSGRVRKTSPLPGFAPRTVQAVASRYTAHAANKIKYYFLIQRLVSVCPTLIILFLLVTCLFSSKCLSEHLNGHHIVHVK